MIKDHILKSLVKGNRLNRITIEITNNCNLRCIHCYQENRKDKDFTTKKNNTVFLDVSYIKKILNEIRPLGVVTITLTGGEVFTHPKFYEIIKEIKKENYNITLLSNITMVNDQNIDFLSENIGHISTSCYGLDAETYESITGVSGSFEKYLAAKKLIKKSKIRFQEKAIIMRQNFHQLEEMLRLTNTSSCEIYVDSKNPYADKCVLDEEQAQKYWSIYFSKNSNEKELIIKNKFGCNHCELCVDSIAIDIYGNIVPCINLNADVAILGNIKSDDLSYIWLSNPKAKMDVLYQLLNQSKCYKCEFGKYNTICAANNYYQTKSIMTPSESSCIVCKSKATVLKGG